MVNLLYSMMVILACLTLCFSYAKRGSVRLNIGRSHSKDYAVAAIV